jgi:hypothetical protein
MTAPLSRSCAAGLRTRRAYPVFKPVAAFFARWVRRPTARRLMLRCSTTRPARTRSWQHRRPGKPSRRAMPRRPCRARCRCRDRPQPDHKCSRTEYTGIFASGNLHARPPSRHTCYREAQRFATGACHNAASTFTQLPHEIAGFKITSWTWTTSGPPCRQIVTVARRRRARRVRRSRAAAAGAYRRRAPGPAGMPLSSPADACGPRRARPPG